MSPKAAYGKADGFLKRGCTLSSGGQAESEEKSKRSDGRQAPLRRVLAVGATSEGASRNIQSYWCLRNGCKLGAIHTRGLVGKEAMPESPNASAGSACVTGESEACCSWKLEHEH
ncbi:hypothetical protein BDV96DRAFT_596092 [Lophiotrema nucula]|uniref:Uncharacterized protein n=1 Tax=Lophiotrema nucula TaxID=690887 RepID=A0A6A5ZKG9_9PLEO|nr:hypothetical protein BDV96DRAFT_596092 [Lophiotrema nucula]